MIIYNKVKMFIPYISKEELYFSMNNYWLNFTCSVIMDFPYKNPKIRKKQLLFCCLLRLREKRRFKNIMKLLPIIYD